jgi:DNA-binding transcriptional LysR family regulator
MPPAPPRGPVDETPDLKDLRAFCLVVDLDGITAAARILGETKGSVSRRLSRLEGQTGVALLRRGPKRVTPTEEGLAYRARLSRPLELLDEAHLELRHAQGTPRGRVRVTAPNDFALMILAPIVASFMARYPEVLIDLLISERRLDFEAEALDVAFRASPALEDSSLVAHKLSDVRGQLFASPAYEEKLGLPRQPSELPSHRLLGASPHAKPLALHRADRPTEALAPLVFSLRSTDFAFVRELALAATGIALLPTELVEQDVEQERLVAVLPEYCAFTGGIFLIHRGARRLAPSVQAFREHVMTALGLARKRARA